MTAADTTVVRTQEVLNGLDIYFSAGLTDATLTIRGHLVYETKKEMKNMYILDGGEFPPYGAFVALNSDGPTGLGIKPAMYGVTLVFMSYCNKPLLRYDSIHLGIESTSQDVFTS